MKIETFETQHLILRKITPEVLDYVFQNVTKINLIEFLGLKSIEELEIEKIKYQKGLQTHNKSFLYFQLLDPIHQSVIGFAGFHTWYLDHSRAEIFYLIIAEENKQKGYISEALDYIIPFGFNNMNLNRIEAFVGLQNIASLKILTKFGFIKEGHAREHYCKNGKIEDSLLFGLLRSDFESKDVSHKTN